MTRIVSVLMPTHVQTIHRAKVVLDEPADGIVVVIDRSFGVPCGFGVIHGGVADVLFTTYPSLLDVHEVEFVAVTRGGVSRRRYMVADPLNSNQVYIPFIGYVDVRWVIIFLLLLLLLALR